MKVRVKVIRHIDADTKQEVLVAPRQYVQHSTPTFRIGESDYAWVRIRGRGRKAAQQHGLI